MTTPEPRVLNAITGTDVQLILVPYDTARRGWRSGAGPEHLLRTGLTAHLRGGGNAIAEVQTIEPDPAQPLAEIATAFDLMRRVAVAVRAARGQGRFPLVLGGNCGVTVGALSGLTPARRALFWFDAHGDLNTPDTTASGFLDGTGLATALGHCWHGLAATVPGFSAIDEAATFVLGMRDLDPPELARLKNSAITHVAAHQLPGALPGVLAGAALHDAVGYVHLDVDVLDPAEVGPGNSLPAPGGLSVEALTASISAIKARVGVGAAAIASYAPEFDTSGAVARATFAAVDAILAQRPS